jgi:hypothetical protein
MKAQVGECYPEAVDIRPAPLREKALHGNPKDAPVGPSYDSDTFAGLLAAPKPLSRPLIAGRPVMAWYKGMPCDAQPSADVVCYSRLITIEYGFHGGDPLRPPERNRADSDGMMDSDGFSH